jgi:hypothetical protein
MKPKEVHLKQLNPAYQTKTMEITWVGIGALVDGEIPKSVFLR